MEINRNQWFMAGIVVLLLGIQFRLVESFVLNDKTTQFLAERSGDSLSAGIASLNGALPTPGASARKEIRPPQWLGWMLMSVGSVLILHSLAMKRPEG